jgi:hypothetical protein
VANERHDASFIVGAILGGLIGGGYALFRVPQAGAETRSQIAARGDDMTQRVSATTGAFNDQTRDLLTRASAETAPIRERLTSIRPGGLVSSPTEGVAPRTEIVTEPVLTLPDPLEPDPVIVESENTELPADDPPNDR